MDSLLFSPLLLLLPLSPATLTLLLVLITFSFFLFNSFLIPPSCLIVSIAKKQKQKRKTQRAIPADDRDNYTQRQYPLERPHPRPYRLDQCQNQRSPYHPLDKTPSSFASLSYENPAEDHAQDLLRDQVTAPEEQEQADHIARPPPPSPSSPPPSLHTTQPSKPEADRHHHSHPLDPQLQLQHAQPLFSHNHRDHPNPLNLLAPPPRESFSALNSSPHPLSQLQCQHPPPPAPPPPPQSHRHPSLNHFPLHHDPPLSLPWVTAGPPSFPPSPSSFEGEHQFIPHAAPLLNPFLGHQPLHLSSTSVSPDHSIESLVAFFPPSSSTYTSTIFSNLNTNDELQPAIFPFPFNTMLSASIPTMATTSTSAVPLVGLPFHSDYHHDSNQMIERIDAAIAAWDDFGFDTTYDLHIQHQHELLSPTVSIASSPTGSTSPTGEVAHGRFTALTARAPPTGQTEESKAFDTFELFSQHDLEFPLADASTSLAGEVTSVSSSCSPSTTDVCLVNGGSILMTSAVPTASDITLPEARSEFALWPESIPLDLNPNLDSKVRQSAPEALNLADSRSSSCSPTPTSSDASSPTSPSYDDIVQPIVACGNCKRSHIKCDHGRPCQNCLKHPSKANNCRDAVPKPRGRPKGGNKTTTDGVPAGRQQQQHLGFHLLPGTPYQTLRGPSEHQSYRQRALSFSYVPLSHESLPYVLQSQHHLPVHSQQRLPYPHPHPHHHHHHHQLIQQQQLHQHHQRAVSRPQTRFPTSDDHPPIPSLDVNLRRLSPGHPPSPYSWGDTGSAVPEVKSMSIPQRSTMSSADLYEMQATSSRPIPVGAPYPPSRHPGGGDVGYQAAQVGVTFASLPSHLQSSFSSGAAMLDPYQRQQLQQHRQKLQRYQQQQLLLQRRRAQPTPHPAMQQHPFFS